MVLCTWGVSPAMAVISLGCQSRRYGKPQKTGVCAPCAPLVLIHPLYPLPQWGDSSARARIIIGGWIRTKGAQGAHLAEYCGLWHRPNRVGAARTAVGSTELHRGERLVRKLIQVMVLGMSVFSVSASASEPTTNLRCTELEKLVVALSPTDIAPTRAPLLRDHVPARNYIWCLGVGFAALGKGQRPKAVILSLAIITLTIRRLDQTHQRTFRSAKLV